MKTIHLRPIEATYHDADLLVRWRNSDSARAAFFNTDVVTTDTHFQFMRSRKPHDLVWIAELSGAGAVGMVGLRVDVKQHMAEHRSLYVAEGYRRQGYGAEIERLVLRYGFEVLRLEYIWADVLQSNEAACRFYERVGWRAVAGDAHGSTVRIIEMRRADWEYGS